MAPSGVASRPAPPPSHIRLDHSQGARGSSQAGRRHPPPRPYPPAPVCASARTASLYRPPPPSPLVSQELAAAGQGPPVVLQDCLRWLALRGLTTPRLFTAPPVALDRKLLALRHLYDTGRRPLRSKSCRDKDPQLVRAGGRGRGAGSSIWPAGRRRGAPRVRSTMRRARSGCGQQRAARALGAVNNARRALPARPRSAPYPAARLPLTPHRADCQPAAAVAGLPA